MPRRSGHGTEESPAPRRTSARIAAAQAASPSKSPLKSPKRKRQSNEQNKSISEDAESQQSQIKSECSDEDLNGLEAKDHDSLTDSQAIPAKKAKVDEKEDNLNKVNKSSSDAEFAADAPVKPVSGDEVDFEVIDKAEVPAPDSAEVSAAISVQGDDGNLLVGFVQVDKDELPPVSNLETDMITINEEQPSEANMVHVESTVNGDSHNPIPCLSDTSSKTETISSNVQNKLCVFREASVHSDAIPAAGDVKNDDDAAHEAATE